MRFLIDVCASSRRMRATLASLGHDVVSALEDDPQASDETLPDTAERLKQEGITFALEEEGIALFLTYRLPIDYHGIGR